MNQITCILFYKNDSSSSSSIDMYVNFSTLACNIAVAFFMIHCLPVANVTLQNKRMSCFLMTLLFLVMFQIALCLAVQCVGISIVWCSLAGWISRELMCFLKGNNTSVIHRSPQWMIPTTTLLLIWDAVIILYYAHVAEPITTMAHLSALVLGFLLSMVSDNCTGRNNITDNNTRRPNSNGYHFINH